MAIDVIQWFDESGQEVAHRWEGGGELKLGTQLVVQESQFAVFFRDGKAYDVFGAGRHTLTTLNIPLLGGLIGKPFGGTSPFRAEVYYINRKVFTDLKWGTKEPVLFRDSEFKMVRLRAFGKFATKVVEPTLFLNTFVGSQGITTVDGIESYMKDAIVARLNDVLGENLKTLLDLARLYDELSEALKSRVKADFAKYGLELVDFLIGSISPPEEVQKLIDEKSGMQAIGDMNTYMQFKAAKSMEEAAKNPSGGASAGVGLGMGAGMGMMIPGMLNQAMQQGQSGHAAPSGAAAAAIACAACGQGNPATSRFCQGCGKPLAAPGVPCPACNAANPAGAKFCNGCGKPLGSPICPKCNALNTAGAKFCSGCGGPLSA